MSWKNLHFRPPILRRPVVGGKSSEYVLIRDLQQNRPPFVGYIILRKDDNRYHVCGQGCSEQRVLGKFIEWTEVPE